MSSREGWLVALLAVSSVFAACGEESLCDDGDQACDGTESPSPESPTPEETAQTSPTGTPDGTASPHETEQPTETGTPASSPAPSTTPEDTTSPGDDDSTAGDDDSSPVDTPSPTAIPVMRNVLLSANPEGTEVYADGEFKNASSQEVRRMCVIITYAEFTSTKCNSFTSGGGYHGNFMNDWTPFTLKYSNQILSTCGWDPELGEPYIDRSCAKWRASYSVTSDYYSIPNPDPSLEPLVRNDLVAYSPEISLVTFTGEVRNPYDKELRYLRMALYNVEVDSYILGGDIYYNRGAVRDWSSFENSILDYEQLVRGDCDWDPILGEPYLDRGCVYWEYTFEYYE